MNLQKNLSMQREGQLEFDAPIHKGTPHPLSKNRNPDSSRIGKKRPIQLQAYGAQIGDSPTLSQFEE
jgi:hypothetical protein